MINRTKLASLAFAGRNTTGAATPNPTAPTAPPSSEKAVSSPVSLAAPAAMPPPSAADAAGPKSARRNPQRFDPATGLSLRSPYAEDNIIKVRSGSFLGLRIPLHNARGHAFEYFGWRVNPFAKEYIRLGVKPRKFNENEATVMGADARDLLKDRNVFSSADLRKLENLKLARNTTYLLIKNLPILPVWYFFPLDEYFPEKHRDIEYLYEKSVGSRSEAPSYEREAAERLRKKDAYMRKRFELDDFLITGIAALLDCAILPRFKEHPIARNMLTDPGEQQSSDLDNLDMALRFQQSTVEKAVPKTRLSYTEVGCLYRIYLCVKNRMRAPVYLLSVKEIVEKHLCPFDPPEYKLRIIDTLRRGTFQRIGPRAPDDPNPQNIVFGPILEDLGNGDWVMSFDHERVRAHNQAKEEENAVFELRQAIRRARRDAIRIDLGPRDILIVDNLRAMTSRREYIPTRLSDIRKLLPTVFRLTVDVRKWRPFFANGQVRKRMRHERSDDQVRVVSFWPFRPHRWLRTYYAFRVVQRSDR
jgi:hypothetical protein